MRTSVCINLQSKPLESGTYPADNSRFGNLVDDGSGYPEELAAEDEYLQELRKKMGVVSQLESQADNLLEPLLEQAESTATKSGARKPTMTTPAPGSALTKTSVTFGWNKNSARVTEWALYVGSSQGSHDLFETEPSKTADPQSIADLPEDRRDLFVRLWFKISGIWQYGDYQYTAAGAGNPNMVSPAPGSVLDGASASFKWTREKDPVSQRWLYGGSRLGGKNIFDSGTNGTSTSYSVSGLPTDGRSLFVRLWFMISDRWYSEDFQYTAARFSDAEITSPEPNSTLDGEAVTFNWTPNDASVADWWIDVGSSQSEADLFTSGSLGDALSLSINDLYSVSGQIFVRLWSRIDASWRFTDYQYTSAMPVPIPNPVPKRDFLVPTAHPQWDGLLFNQRPGLTELIADIEIELLTNSREDHGLSRELLDLYHKEGLSATGNWLAGSVDKALSIVESGPLLLTFARWAAYLNRNNFGPAEAFYRGALERWDAEPYVIWWSYLRAKVDHQGPDGALSFLADLEKQGWHEKPWLAALREFLPFMLADEPDLPPRDAEPKQEGIVSGMLSRVARLVRSRPGDRPFRPMDDITIDKVRDQVLNRLSVEPENLTFFADIVAAYCVRLYGDSALNEVRSSVDKLTQEFDYSTHVTLGTARFLEWFGRVQADEQSNYPKLEFLDLYQRALDRENNFEAKIPMLRSLNRMGEDLSGHWEELAQLERDEYPNSATVRKQHYVYLRMQRRDDAADILRSELVLAVTA